MSEEAPLLLPKFDYHLDESDADVPVLRRKDGSFVAAFSARGATGEGILEAAREHAGPLALESEAHRSRGTRAPSGPYSPNLVEGLFSEVRL